MAAWISGWSAHKRRRRWYRAVLLGLALLAFMLPLLWTVLASFNILPDDTESPPIWTGSLSLENYREIGATTPEFFQELATSISISATATVLTIIAAFTAAYSLVRSRFPSVWISVQGFLIFASVPVMAYVIPLRDTIRYLQLYDTLAGVVLADTAVFVPLAVYILYGYLNQIPLDLQESAHLEGASPWQIIWRVVVPMAAPGVAATAIIVFVLNWNLLLVPQVLTEHNVRTIPIALTDFFKLEREIEWPAAAAVLIASLIPVAVLVAVAHRALERFSLMPIREISS